jgi:hypothetical protein
LLIFFFQHHQSNNSLLPSAVEGITTIIVKRVKFGEHIDKNTETDDKIRTMPQYKDALHKVFFFPKCYLNFPLKTAFWNLTRSL